MTTIRCLQKDCTSNEWDSCTKGTINLIDPSPGGVTTCGNYKFSKDKQDEVLSR